MVAGSKKVTEMDTSVGPGQSASSEAPNGSLGESLPTGQTATKRARAGTVGDIDTATAVVTPRVVIGDATAEPAVDNGKGNGKGKGRGGRRKRRSNQGKEPTKIRSNDSATLHVLNIMSRLLLQVTANTRLLSGLMLTTIIMPKIAEPVVSLLKQQDIFRKNLQEARDNTQEGQPPPAIGAPHCALFMTMLGAMVKLEIGQKSRQTLQEWIDAVGQATVDASTIINETCQSFQIFQVQSNNDKTRLQIAMSTGPIRVAVLQGLNQLDKVHISTGAAPAGYLEEELASWLHMLKPTQ